MVAELNPDRLGTQSKLPAGGQGVLVTEQTAHQRELDELLEDGPIDPEVASMAQAIARRLGVRPRSRRSRNHRGTGALLSMPYAYRSDDIDLDRSIELLAERPVLEDTDIIVRERTAQRRAAVLIVDVSGSMRGEKVRIAAATVAALSAELSGPSDQLAWWHSGPTLPCSSPSRYRPRTCLRRSCLINYCVSLPVDLPTSGSASRLHTPSWRGPRSLGAPLFCSPMRCTTQVLTRATSQADSAICTFSSRQTVSTTCRSVATWPGSAMEVCIRCTPTETSRLPESNLQ